MNRRKACTAFAALALAPAFALAEDRDDRREERREERDKEEHHRYRKGERLREEERRNEFVVNDWHERRLREPPHGYHWVRNGDDYVLAAIATGVIADVVLNH